MTLEELQKAGSSEEEARKYVDSGYVYNDTSGTIIDRYYGGLLLSTDLRTRFEIGEFGKWPAWLNNRVWVKAAASWADVYRIAEEAASKTRKRLLFRGQGRHYLINRAAPNPWFLVDGIGEISLVPSLWRKMLSRFTNKFPSFQGLSLLEWSLILYNGFDLEDIKRRHQEKVDKEGWGEMSLVAEATAMEECDDPVLAEFGKFRLDLLMGMEHNLATLLATLLQHYGLLSPVLDLTSSLEVARFFATHKFEKTEAGCSYEFNGTNGRQAVIYVLREEHREMQAHESQDPILKKLKPLRPQRQHCVVSTSSAYALNLPADFLEGVILLDFDDASSGCEYGTHCLLPDESEDRFLDALKKTRSTKDRITCFGKQSESPLSPSRFT
ncbi:FRG domain-containing protein [Haloferula sp. BvORR071]|uniref:FRG domain-containing protein n=1 Tax=Haloferula sp. BvORR071 TaxID=1396141 RepID=UPI0005560AB6|nr:FRG domain-containing protein [Haloferula sp. BvORR071]